MEERVRVAMVSMAVSSRLDKTASTYYPLVYCKSGDFLRQRLEWDVGSCLLAADFLLLLEIFIAGFDRD